MNKYIGAALLLGFLSCRNTDHKVAESSEKASKSKKVSNSIAVIPDIKFGNSKVQAIYTDYISLKDALVNSKYAAAQVASKSLASKLNAYDGCENTALIADKITGAVNIEEQRKEFTFLSSDVIAMFKHADLKKGAIYVQHCPMANHGDGGDWLSSEKKIRNPYYGSKMMECGGVLEEIKVN